MKTLIPAAGLGTRWHPWSKIVPKELLPLGPYPAIHYVLKEAVAAAISEIGIIISKTKQLIRTYVEDVWMVNHQEIQNYVVLSAFTGRCWRRFVVCERMDSTRTNCRSLSG